MGTGGFLITYLRNIMQKATAQNITIDWNYIKNGGIYGKECNLKTYQLAVSNMLISSGHIFSGLDKGDSIRQPIARKFDNILANPPFGIKGMDWDAITSDIKDKYLPIRTTNAVSLFLQAIIYMLNINGKCAVVLPDGKDLSSLVDGFVQIRKYLMKTCDLKEVIYLPQKTFTYTTIRTCILFFIKKHESEQVMQITNVVKKDGTTKQTITYNDETFQTTKVQFYEFDATMKNKTLLVEATIDKLAKKAFVLTHNDYLRDDNDADYLYPMQSINEICTYMPKSKKHASFGKTEGSHPFFTSSQNGVLRCSEVDCDYDCEQGCIIIGTGGSANVKYATKFSCSTDNFVLTCKEGVLAKYVYYVLLNNIQLLACKFSGLGLQHINKENLDAVKIPIMSIEKQQELIAKCEQTDATIKQTYDAIEKLEKDIELHKKGIREHIVGLMDAKKEVKK